MLGSGMSTSCWAKWLLGVRYSTLVPIAYLLFHEDEVGRSWLSQLKRWLGVLRIALSLLQVIHPAADFCHHWTDLQMNSEIILATPVVDELNNHY